MAAFSTGAAVCVDVTHVTTVDGASLQIPASTARGTPRWYDGTVHGTQPDGQIAVRLDRPIAGVSGVIVLAAAAALRHRQPGESCI